MKSYDFVSLGDITTDAFIRIKDADVHMNHGQRELCFRFGDKIPYEFVRVVSAVGNSPNAAVSAARLGLSSAVITNVGDDENGKECLAALTKNNVDTALVTTHQGHKTNYHYVLWYKAERTILIKHEEYDYALPEMAPPRWIYLSSLGENSLPFHKEIAAYVKEHNIRLAFQPGTFQIHLGYEKLKAIYENSEVFFCNKEEAQRILATKEDDMTRLLQLMHERGPNIVCITDGPNGAYGYDGKEGWMQPMYPDPAPPVDRTGAGDSFSSTFTIAISKGKSLKEALRWGPVNSMSVVQHIGAQEGLLSENDLQKFLKDAPESYRPEKIL